MNNLSFDQLKAVRNVHFTGVKGVGMTGLAVIAAQNGVRVTGSDVAERFITDDVLVEAGVELMPGFDPARVETADLVIVTGAHGGKTNPEPQHAIARGIPVLMQAQAAAMMITEKSVIAVSGSHGKTTTSALAAWTLLRCGVDAGYLIGTSEIGQLDRVAQYGDATQFVIEADEYQTCPLTDPTPRFLYLSPQIAVITNIELDHPDRYASLADVTEAFRQFVARIKPGGTLIACIDDPAVRDLVAESPDHLQLITYGKSTEADYCVRRYRATPEGTVFEIVDKFTQGTQAASLKLRGEHNALNATAVYAVCAALELPGAQVAEALGGFSGVKRRFEYKGERHDVPVYDDYGHHPTEIQATLRAMHDFFPESRIITVFQPHTYSRTERLFDDFVGAFTETDVAVITPIFASAREPAGGQVSSEDLVRRVNERLGHAVYVEDFAAAVEYLERNARPGDVVLTIGAGNVYQIGEAFLAAGQA